MYSDTDQCCAGLCFPDTPAKLCLLQGGKERLSLPWSCNEKGSDGLWHRQPQVAPGHGAISLFLSQLNQVCWDDQCARSPITSHPACWPQQTLHLLTNAPGMQMVQKVSSDHECGGKVAFFLHWLLLQSQKMRILQSQHFVFTQTLSPGHIMTPWKKKDGNSSRKAAPNPTYWAVQRISIAQQGVPLPWAIQSHFQSSPKCSEGTPHLAGIRSMAPDSLCLCIITIVNQILWVTMWWASPLWPARWGQWKSLQVESARDGFAGHWALTSLLRIQIILSSSHRSCQEWVKQLK